MAVVTPFRALRYDFAKAGPPETVCCPPYDVIPDPSVWTRAGRYNAILLEGGERLGTADPYGGAERTLSEWISSGILRRDGTPGFYIYEVLFRSRSGEPRLLRGLAGLLKLSPFSDGVVLPHEYTLSAAKEDRYRLTAGTGCQFSPVYGLYDDPSGQVETLIAQSPGIGGAVSFGTADGCRHTLRAVTDTGLCAALTDAFADKKVFIADGHHRYETLLRLRDETGKPEYAMVFLAEMNGPGIEVWATHRVLSALDGYDETAVRARLGERYTLSEGTVPPGGTVPPAGTVPSGGADIPADTFVWLTGSGAWYLTPKAPSSEKSSVAALHKDILEPLFGIDAGNMAKQTNLSYTRDAAEAEKLVRSGAAQCAFLLPPFKMSELRNTVLSGGRMPQKSTYFYPKIITGLFMHEF